MLSSRGQCEGLPLCHHPRECPASHWFGIMPGNFAASSLPSRHTHLGPICRVSLLRGGGFLPPRALQFCPFSLGGLHVDLRIRGPAGTSPGALSVVLSTPAHTREEIGTTLPILEEEMETQHRGWGDWPRRQLVGDKTQGQSSYCPLSLGCLRGCFRLCSLHFAKTCHHSWLVSHLTICAVHSGDTCQGALHRRERREA